MFCWFVERVLLVCGVCFVGLRLWSVFCWFVERILLVCGVCFVGFRLWSVFNRFKIRIRIKRFLDVLLTTG